jgi:site-specific recombinase XerD
MNSTATSYYRLVSTPGLLYRYQVVGPDGLPELALTLFAKDQLKSLSESSIPLYLREILALANWSRSDHVALSRGWTLFSPPEDARALLREYLVAAAKCKITVRPDLLGLRASYINATNGTRVNVRTLLSALRRLYEFLILDGRYSHRNPMIHDDAARVRAEVWEKHRQAIRALRGREPMPPQSGVDEPSAIRLSENYFRYRQKQWEPQTIDDPDFPNLVHSSGRRFGWKLREFCVSRTLFESGARISEVVSLTAFDWASRGFRNFLQARNKGSHGTRVKTLMISNPTAKLYRRYFDDDVDGRAAHDPRCLHVSNLTTLYRTNPQSLAEIPLFLTAQGEPMTAKLFREQYWKPALMAAGIDADPHQARHWFVTNALRNIDGTARDEAERVRRRQELIQYMAWRSGERTLQAYDHVQRKADFEVRLQGIHDEMKKRERKAVVDGAALGVQAVSKIAAAECTVNELAFLLGEDDDN